MPLLPLLDDGSQTALTRSNIGAITSRRSNATEAFKRVMRPAQKDAVVFARDVSKIPMWKEPWPDHTLPAWSRLFRGIGPEDLADGALDAVKPNKGWAQRAYMSPKEVTNLEGMWNSSRELTERLVSARPTPATLATPATATPGTTRIQHESPRPVVTYLWRDNYKRSVLNTHDVLSYVLKRYNVTLRVTSLQEPLPDVVDLMSTSDVVIGMHGAGWTNGLFLKRGAATLQLIPYGWVKEDGAIIRGDSRAKTPTPLALRLARSSVHRPMPLDTGTDTGTDADRLRLRRCHLPSPVPRPPSPVPRPPSPVSRLSSLVSRPPSPVSRLSSLVPRPPSLVRLSSLVSRLSSLVSRLPRQTETCCGVLALAHEGETTRTTEREKILLFHSFRASLRVHFITIYSIDDTSLREPKSPAHESEPSTCAGSVFINQPLGT
jgi:hypothetical protein